MLWSRQPVGPISPAVVQPTAVSLEGSQPLEKMPGAVTKVVFDYATRIVQVLGRTPDGKGWTVYAVETNGNAVFSDAQLPSQPVAIPDNSRFFWPLNLDLGGVKLIYASAQPICQLNDRNTRYTVFKQTAANHLIDFFVGHGLDVRTHSTEAFFQPNKNVLAFF